MRLLILAGFLGSGKTTLLQALADTFTPAQRAKLVIIENEAGERGVDDQLLAADGLDVRQVYGGCICCTLRANLQRALIQVAEALAPDWIIVEPSGVADPSEVVALARSSGLEFERIDLVVLIDALRWDRLRQVAGPFLERGVQRADVVALNKVDAIDETEAQRLLDELEALRGGPVQRLAAAQGEGLDELWTAIDLAGPARLAPDGPAPRLAHATLTAAWTLAFAPPVDPGELVRRLRDAESDLAARIVGSQPGAVGHLKALLQAGGQQVVCRRVRWSEPPRLDGRLDGPVTTARVTVQVVLAGVAGALDEGWLADWPRRLGGEPVS